jgi:predicted DNA-binding transcriptional regulator YafY
MNRTDRLLAIVLELQARGQQRAEDLAATFEVSKRTIYRDVLALCEAGVPVVSTPGLGYALSEGYFLPPLRFTPDEAVMLLLGSEVVAQSFDAEYRVAAEAAARKIAGALPEATRDLVREIQQGLLFVERGSGDESPDLRALRRAIIARRRIRFRYLARDSAEGAGVERVREADPYGLVRIAEIWYLVGYCHLRGDTRSFRLSRMSELRVLAQQFERPANLVLQSRDAGRDTIVRVQFDNQVAPWVREAHYYYVSEMQPNPAGLLVTLHVRSIEDVLQWVLGWGRHVHVLEPPELRELVIREVAAVSASYQVDRSCC